MMLAFPAMKESIDDLDMEMQRQGDGGTDIEQGG